MFRLEKDGIKLEFEYDKDEELLKYIEAIKPFMVSNEVLNSSVENVI